MSSQKIYQDLLKLHDLKVTPQRLAVMQAVDELNNHPTSDEILKWVCERQPGIGTGTIYNILDTLAEHGILVRVKTGEGKMRYDSVSEHHHHLYCEESGEIGDYFDPELDRLLADHFSKKNISGFDVSDIQLHIKGKFKK